nr:LysM peptidoglycan-binding domain-containing protein [Wenyingzhuangia fucanilytica]
MVERKETLYSIAKKYDLTVDELKKINHLRNNDLSIGQELRVE